MTQETTERARIVVLSGDHVGKEVTKAALKVLKVIDGLRSKKYGLNLEIVFGKVGGEAIDQCNEALPKETIELIDDLNTKAILFGAIGGPEWPPNSQVRPEQGTLFRDIFSFNE